MSVYDAYVRYFSCYSGIASKKLVGLSTEEFSTLIRKYNMSGFFSNISIASYAADELTAGQLMEEIQSIQKKKRCHYDCIIVDYDENISYEDVDDQGAGQYEGRFQTEYRGHVKCAEKPGDHRGQHHGAQAGACGADADGQRFVVVEPPGHEDRDRHH